MGKEDEEVPATEAHEVEIDLGEGDEEGAENG